MVWRLEYIDGNHHWRWKVSFGFFSSFPVFLWVSGALHIWAFIDECVEQHEAEQGNQKRNNWQVDFCIDPKMKKRGKKTSAPVESVSNLTGVNQEVAAVCIDETAARESLNYGMNKMNKQRRCGWDWFLFISFKNSTLFSKGGEGGLSWGGGRVQVMLALFVPSLPVLLFRGGLYH